jgi:redox-regulated HSP33 family molecular chaperone
MDITNICKQLEDLATDLELENHKPSCAYLKLIKSGHPNRYPVFRDGDTISPEDLCDCNIAKHEHKIMILKTQIQDMLEFWGIKVDCTYSKCYGDDE